MNNIRVIIGDTDYNAACYYIYASLDTDILRENLKYTPDAEELIQKAIAHIDEKLFVAQLQYTVTQGIQEEDCNQSDL